MVALAEDYIAGLDIGQANDPSALCVIERVGPRLHVRHLERLPLGLPYPAQVERVAGVLDRPPLVGHVRLVLDATGVGRPVLDLFDESSELPDHPRGTDWW